MVDRETVRPIYSELQGYLSSAPGNISTMAREKGLWEQINEAIEELEMVTKKDYSRFKPVPDEHTYVDGRAYFLSAANYMPKLSGLISRLHGEYFSDEQAPFSDMPSTVISQTQQQSQSFQVELRLQIESKIDEQLSKLRPDDEKRGFLEKVKGALKSVRNATELIALLLRTGQEFGLSLEQLSELFR